MVSSVHGANRGGMEPKFQWAARREPNTYQGALRWGWPRGGCGAGWILARSRGPCIRCRARPSLRSIGGGREGGATPPRYYLGRRGARREPRPERTRGGGFRPESAARQPCCDRRRAAVGIPGLGHFPGFPAVGVTKPNALPRGRPWAGRKGRGRCLGGFLLFLPRAWGKGRKVPPSSPVLAAAEGSAWATSPSPQENPIKGSICPRAEGLRGFGHAPASKDMGVPAAPHPRPRLL